MTPTLPLSETIFADAAIGLVRDMYIRSYPNPNEDGSVGTLANLSAATFTGWCRDAYDTSVVTDFAGYITGNASGRMRISMSASVLANVPVGTHRYLIAINGIPSRTGPFVVSGVQPLQSWFTDMTTEEGADDTFTVYGTVYSPTAVTMTVMSSAQRTFNITSIAGLLVESGDLVATLSVASTNVPGLTSISVTTAAQSVTPTGGTYGVAVGNMVELTLSSISPGTTRFAFALNGTYTD